VTIVLVDELKSAVLGWWCVEGETLQGSCFMDTLTGGLKMSRCALTHKFKKILTLSRCRSCDSYIYMNGGLQCCWVLLTHSLTV